MRVIHNALLSCISKLVGFIDFSKAKYTLNDEEHFVIPSKDSYVKIQLLFHEKAEQFYATRLLNYFVLY